MRLPHKNVTLSLLFAPLFFTSPDSARTEALLPFSSPRLLSPVARRIPIGISPSVRCVLVFCLPHALTRIMEDQCSVVFLLL